MNFLDYISEVLIINYLRILNSFLNLEKRNFNDSKIAYNQKYAYLVGDLVFSNYLVYERDKEFKFVVQYYWY